MKFIIPREEVMMKETNWKGKVQNLRKRSYSKICIIDTIYSICTLFNSNFICFFVIRKHVIDCKKVAISLILVNPGEYFGKYTKRLI